MVLGLQAMLKMSHTREKVRNLAQVVEALVQTPGKALGYQVHTTNIPGTIIQERDLNIQMVLITERMTEEINLVLIQEKDQKSIRTSMV